MIWPTPPLGALVTTIVPARDRPEDLDGPIPWLRIEDFGGKWISSSRSGLGVSIETMNLRTFPAGTVACSCSCDMGTVAIVKRELVTNQTFIGLFPRSTALASDYLYWSLQGHRGQLNAQATGAIQQYLSRDDFRNLRLPLPPLRDQRVIASLLDMETARIDALIAKKRRMIELVGQRRSGAIESTIRSLASEWGESRLKFSAGKITVGIVVRPSDWYAPRGVLALRGINVTPGRIVLEDVVRISSEGHAEHRKSELRNGDVVVVRTGQAGAAAVVPPELAGANCIDLLLVRRSPSLLPKYLEYVINSDWTIKHIERYSVGTIQSHFNVEALRELPVPVPDISAQRAVVEELEGVTARLDQLAGRLTRQIDLLAEHRQALITAAVTGQMEIPGVAA